MATLSIAQLKKLYYSQKSGQTTVFDTRFRRPTTARGKRRPEPKFPPWAFKPKYRRVNGKLEVLSSAHLIEVTES